MYGLKDLTQFKHETQKTKFGFKVRGSNIEVIDSLLEEWEKQQTQNSPQATLKILSDLIVACKAWRRLKTQQKGAPGFNDQSSYASRFLAITAVGNQAVQKLFQIDQALAAANQIYLNRKNNGIRPQNLKGLSAGYINERESYLFNNKSTNISGSGMTELFKELGRDYTTKTDRTTSSRINVIVKNKTLDTLNPEEYTKVANLAKTLPGSPDLMMKYYRRLERVKLAAQVHNGLLADYNGKYLNKAYLYVLDRYGNLIIQTRRVEGLVERLNHSSLSSGKEVACAGLLSVDNGKLKSLSTNSGHYKPTRQNLIDSLVYLENELGVDISECEPETWLPSHQQGFMTVRIYSNLNSLVNNVVQSQQEVKLNH